MSYLKKYTIIGGFICEDKKYLAKEWLMIGIVAACCLEINQVIMWPVAFVALVLPVTFLIFDVLLKKLTERRVQESNIGPPPSSAEI